MRVNTSIGLAAVILIAASMSGFAATAAETGRATMLSPIVIYPSDVRVADNGLRTGRSSARDMHARAVSGLNGQNDAAERPAQR